ncbi:unnamed protein product [marine sediment metagenome]|uniref:DUF4145 domain-containing protein n=1 Tax=marine sediment metagenome TaxID=412755 RepID=X1DTM9_9ZZZZ
MKKREEGRLEIKLKNKLEDHFQRLINEGKTILKKYGYFNGEFRGSYPTGLEYNKWYSSTRNLIGKACGGHGPHYKQMEDAHALAKGYTHRLPECLGVLESAYEDFKLGLLEDTKALITAEVFTDFIEQAEYLLDEGYKLPAAVLMRGVLEDSLRTLCKKAKISLTDKPKLNWMNSELVKEGIYNKNVHKQITAWAAIGNSAAHMKINEFSDIDVKNMISGIINFNATLLK